MTSSKAGPSNQCSDWDATKPSKLASGKGIASATARATGTDGVLLTSRASRAARRVQGRSPGQCRAVPG